MVHTLGKRSLVLLVSLCVCAFLWSNGNEETSTEKTVLHVAHFYDSMEEGEMTGYKWFQKVKADFETVHPDIEIAFEQFKWDEIDVKIMSDFRSCITTHDVLLTTPQLLPQHAAVGDLEDLNPYIQANWTPEQLEEIAWASTYRQALQDGKQVGIPLGSHSRIALYNKSMFANAGLDPETPPSTMESLIAAARKLTLDTDGDGSIDQWGLGVALGPDRGTIEVTFAPLVWGYGGTLFDKTEKRATFAEQPGIEAATLLWDLVNTYGIVSPSSIVNTYNRNIYDGVLQGKIAIAFGWGSFWLNALEENGMVQGLFPPTEDGAMTEIGVFPYPTEGGAGFTNSWDISMYSRSEHKEEAWAFIEYVLDEADLSTYPDAGLPIKKSVWQRPEYRTPYFQTYYQAIANGRSMPESAHYGELADIVFAALQRCMAAQRAEISGILMDAQNAFNTKYQGQ